MFHTAFVLTTLAGKPVSWQAQDRGDRGIRFTEALSRHKWHVLLGVVWGAAILVIAPRYIWWMSPVLVGLILSVPLTVVTSRTSVGRWVRRRGLLLTPEETDPPSELMALEQGLAAAEVVEVERKTLLTGSGTIVTIDAVPHGPRVPVNVPLPMEAAPPVYLRPRHALIRLQRLVGSEGGAS
jgi:membrane glycosyltransferase